MPKYIVPFVNSNNWETNSNCNLCPIIDALYNKAIIESDPFQLQYDLSDLDNYLVVDGYNLLPVYETDGYVIDNSDPEFIVPIVNLNIQRISQYQVCTDLFMLKVNKVLYPTQNIVLPGNSSIDNPVIIHSRWCKKCASRKPDIYDTERQENLNLLTIENFNVTLLSPDDTINYFRASISWNDLNSNAWNKTVLLRQIDRLPQNDTDGEILKEYTGIKNLYNDSNPYFDNNLEPGYVYYYQIFAYDNLGQILKSSNILFSYVTIDNFTPPSIITDLTTKQVRSLSKVESSYQIKDNVEITWTNPVSEGFIGTILRISDKFVPFDENSCTGVSGKELSINDSSDPASLSFGHTYYFRVFPYDETKYIPNPIGPGYVPYENFNRNSPPSIINIVSYPGNVTALVVIGGDQQISLTWTDPVDLIWTGTKIMYKVGSMILNEHDGVIVETTTRDELNKYQLTPLVIPNLKNNTTYYVGVFPMTSNNIIELSDLTITPDTNIASVTVQNQKSAIVGSWVELITVNFETSDYLNYFTHFGRWKVELDNDIHSGHDYVLRIENLNSKDSDNCFMALYNVAYGAVVSFDYKISMVPNMDTFTFSIVNNETTDVTFSDTGNFLQWRNVAFNIDAGDGIKLIWNWTKGHSSYNYGFVAIDNIIITYNH